jgi:hypothetical protein
MLGPFGFRPGQGPKSGGEWEARSRLAEALRLPGLCDMFNQLLSFVNVSTVGINLVPAAAARAPKPLAATLTAVAAAPTVPPSRWHMGESSLTLEGRTCPA